MDPSDHQAREAAICHVYGPLEILAGHGTGKTTLLLERYAHLVRERLAWPYEILLLSFTRRAAVQPRRCMLPKWKAINMVSVAVDIWLSVRVWVSVPL